MQWCRATAVSGVEVCLHCSTAEVSHDSLMTTSTGIVESSSVQHSKLQFQVFIELSSFQGVLIRGFRNQLLGAVMHLCSLSAALS